MASRPALKGVDHPVRLAILQVLEHRDAGAAELARRLGISSGSARHHLRRLRDCGLVRPGDARGQWRVCRRGWSEVAELLDRLAAEDAAPGLDPR